METGSSRTMFVDLPAPGRRLGRAVIFRQALWPTVGGPARTTSARSDSEADVRRGYHASANVRWTVTSARPVARRGSCDGQACGSERPATGTSKSRLTNQSGPGPSGRRRRKFTVTALESRPGPGRPGPGLAQHFDWQNRRRPGSGYIHGNSGLHAGTTCPRIPMLTFATEKLSTRIMMRLPSFVRAVLNELSCVGTQAGSRGFQGTLGSFTLDSESYKAHMQCEKI